MDPTIDSIKVGSRVIIGKYGAGAGTPEPIVWLKATPNCDFISEDVIDCICFDEREPLNQAEPTARWAGNADYKLSNILKFICSDQGEWYFKSHTEDNPPHYAGHPGFLYYFEEYEVDSIAMETYEVMGSQVSSIIRLPSEAGILGDRRFPLFKKRGVRPHPSESLAANKPGLEFTKTAAQYAPFWCAESGPGYVRTPGTKVMTIGRDGYLRPKYPADSCGLRPVCTMKPEKRLELIDKGLYTLIPYDVTHDEVYTDAEILALLGLTRP